MDIYNVSLVAQHRSECLDGPLVRIPATPGSKYLSAAGISRARASRPPVVSQRLRSANQPELAGSGERGIAEPGHSARNPSAYSASGPVTSGQDGFVFAIMNSSRTISASGKEDDPQVFDYLNEGGAWWRTRCRG